MQKVLIVPSIISPLVRTAVGKDSPRGIDELGISAFVNGRVEPTCVHTPNPKDEFGSKVVVVINELARIVEKEGHIGNGVYTLPIT